MKYMDPAEFRDIGYLQEVNRLMLHPLGLALGVRTDDLSGVTTIFIWDCREDPEGVLFTEGLIQAPDAKEKAIRVNELAKNKEYTRRQVLGGSPIQGVPGFDL